MKHVTIYTDGSSYIGFGGAAAILIGRTRTKEVAHGFSSAVPLPREPVTNQRMELAAAVLGLGTLKEPAGVNLISDSAYLVNAFKEGWIENWRQNGWKNAANKDVKNRDLWVSLHVQTDIHEVTFTHVLGHRGDKYNERADELARQARMDAMSRSAMAKVLRRGPRR